MSGLREALEELVTSLRDSSIEESADWGAGGAYSDSARRLERLLAAHPEPAGEPDGSQVDQAYEYLLRALRPWRDYIAVEDVNVIAEGLAEAVGFRPEPATGVSEQAVEAAVVAFREAHAEGVIVGRHEKAIRAVLAAAAPYMGVRPVVDREALWEAIVKVRDASPRVPYDADSWDIVDAVMDLLTGGGSETTDEASTLS